MKQEDIANLLGVSKATASKYENGNVDLTALQLVILSDFFGVTLDQLVKTDLSKEDAHEEM